MAEAGRPPLDGIRVLDFSRVIAGPLCTQQLADLGAEVLKIENPRGGDDTRRFAAPGAAGQSHFFLAFNRSKRSVALDVTKPEARAAVLALAARSDVLVENFRPGVMARLGLDYPSLFERCPGLVYLSISAYGQTGPMSDRPGFDPVVQAESGMMSLNGEPEGPPLRHPLSIIDTLTAHQAVGAVTAALYARRDTGRGQHIDLALLDVAVQALGNAGLYYLCGGGQPPRTGNAHMTSTPTLLMETADAPLYMALGTDRLFGRLCRDVLGRPDLAEDPRFLTAPDRLRHRPELFAILGEIFAARPRAEWVARMRSLPAGPVRTIGECLESEEVAARRMVLELADADAAGEGRMRLLGSPLKLSGSRLREPAPPPRLGADTEAVLREVGGLDDAALAELRRAGAFGGEAGASRDATAG